MRINRVWAMPTADTFDCPPIGELVKRYLRGVSVDPFARNKRWATYTNDLNPETQAEFHMDAAAFLGLLRALGVEADCILLDPPYSPRQIAECYKAAGIKTDMQSTQNAALLFPRQNRRQKAVQTRHHRNQLRLEQRGNGATGIRAGRTTPGRAWRRT
jgi:hypothetical protein